AQFKAQHHILKLPEMPVHHCALTNPDLEIPRYTGDQHIPVTYVPARNTLFLSFALAYADLLQAEVIYIGVSAVDYSGYPDCRPEYIQAYQSLASLATKSGVEGHPIEIRAPLIHLSKAQTIALGHSLNIDYHETISCYQANHQGEACGQCDSCMLRKKGFHDAQCPDQTRYAKPIK
ncbi:MAG: 7-cyano-7-deazaguanine synthase, partial [Legionellaceae bacterium]